MCRAELTAKQSQFHRRITGHGRWSYDLAAGVLQLGETFPITVVGTHSPGHQTWLWAWANEDFPAAARAAAARLQPLAEFTGFRVFLEPGVPAGAADAYDLTVLAVHHLGGIGFFRVPAADAPTLYLAVHEPDPEVAS